MDVLSRSADEFGNDSMVEELWAMKAIEHADIYFNLISSVDPRYLQLTPYDNEIYTAFRQDFPHLNVAHIDENEIKSADGKTKWRAFIEKFNKLPDFSYGTLLRADANKEFGPDNSMFILRIQFWAIEIARNREGYNDNIRHLYGSNFAKENNIISTDNIEANKT